MKSISGGGDGLDRWALAGSLDLFHYLSLSCHPSPGSPKYLALHASKLVNSLSNTPPNMVQAADSLNGYSNTALEADYAGPTTTKTFIHPLPAAANTSIEDKTNYLSALRKSVVKLQDEVNGFLTTKMEEDKALAEGAGVKIDDKADEENYGEEKVDDDG